MALDLFLALAAYIPRDRVYTIVHPQAALAEDGVALIADISGFTPLTEALTQGLREGEGAEALTRALDAVFTPLIAEIHAFRGSVIKFGGDALIVWFGRPRRGWQSAVIRRAVTAAWRMQQLIREHGQVSTPIGVVTLKMKIGMAYGPVKRFKLGLAEYGYEDVLAGATLDRMAQAEHHAQPGDIVLDKETADLLPHIFTIGEWRGEFAVVSSVEQPTRRRPWPLLRPSPEKEGAFIKELAPYLPPPIYESLLTGQAQVAELKPVVSVFIQFQGLDYDHDPDIAEKLQTYFVLAQRLVARYNGRLNRLITGDKGSLLHIIFGAPRSVEEQEARAIRCALDLQAAGADLPFVTMQRMGMTRGRVFVGPVGSPTRHDYTTMGDSINLSARLMQQAADNQVLLETAVREQLGDHFQVSDLGHIQVKGKTDPIHVFAAVGVQAQRTRRTWHRIPHIFGREHELALLHQRIAALAQGRGSMMTLIGEVGMGKTLMFDVFRAQTEAAWGQNPDKAGLWASGISLAYGQIFSGYVFIDLLRDLLNLPSDATSDQASYQLSQLCADVFGPHRLASTYPYLARFMGLPLEQRFAQRIEGLAGESLRWQVFELIPALFRILSGRRPVVLTLDDLQWADPTSLQLVESLLPLLGDAPIFLILAMRPEPDIMTWAQVQHKLAAYILQRQAGEEGQLELAMTLDRLSDEAAARLIAYHAPHLPRRVVAYLVEKGGGSPLFLVEMVRTLQARGFLSGEIDLEMIALDALDLPTSVQGLLLAQLDRLAVEARHTLQMASVIGKTFLHKVLETVAGAEQQVTAQLATLEEKEYIQPADRTDLGTAHTFRHILIQESAYNTLLHERRRDYHQEVAEALEQLFPGHIAEQAAFLAYHYERAEVWDRAIYYHQQTADQARLLYAHQEAISLYHKILDLLARQTAVDPAHLLQRQAKTYLKLAQTYANALEFAQAQEFYERAFALLDQVEGAAEPVIGAPDAGPEAEKVLRWGVLREYAQDFDPGLVDPVENKELVANLFEGLVDLDNDWNVIVGLARRWQIDNDGRRYLFELREGLKWSDGAPLTAYDFVFAWRRNLTPQTNASMAHQLYVVKGAEAFHQGSQDDPASVAIRALDDLHLEVELETPIGHFLYLLTEPIAYPQPSHRVQALGTAWSQPAHLVCNGPFKVMREAAEGAVSLVRNAFYRGFTAGNLDKVMLHFSHPSIAEFTAGNIDWCRVDDQADLPARFPQETYVVQGYITFLLGFACHVRPFQQKSARQAFAQAIDRRHLVEQVWSGVQRTASGGVVPPGMLGHSPEIGVQFDPDTAQVLRQRSDFDGWGERPLTLAALPGFGETPQYLQESWRAHLGIEVQVVQDVPADQLIVQLSEGQVHLALIGYYLAYPNPDEILRGLFHSDSSTNYFYWSDEQFDALLDQAMALPNQQERLALYHEADKLLVSDRVAVVPLYYLQAYGLMRRGFKLEDAGKIIRTNTIKFKNIVVVSS